MARFVLLRHECPSQSGKPRHWDFMLEHHAVLLTWSLPELPSDWPTGSHQSGKPTSSVVAIRLPDHRLAYLDYEGPISNGRGTVTRVAAGHVSFITESDALFEVRLEGNDIAAHVRLTRQSGDQWTLATTQDALERAER